MSASLDGAPVADVLSLAGRPLVPMGRAVGPGRVPPRVSGRVLRVLRPVGSKSRIGGGHGGHEADGDKGETAPTKRPRTDEG